MSPMASNVTVDRCFSADVYPHQHDQWSAANQGLTLISLVAKLLQKTPLSLAILILACVVHKGSLSA